MNLFIRMHDLFVLFILNILEDFRNKVKVHSVEVLSSQTLDVITGILKYYHVCNFLTPDFFTSVEGGGYSF
jgi:hypothetical protein